MTGLLYQMCSSERLRQSKVYARNAHIEIYLAVLGTKGVFVKRRVEL